MKNYTKGWIDLKEKKFPTVGVILIMKNLVKVTHSMIHQEKEGGMKGEEDVKEEVETIDEKMI